MQMMFKCIIAFTSASQTLANRSEGFISDISDLDHTLSINDSLVSAGRIEKETSRHNAQQGLRGSSISKARMPLSALNPSNGSDDSLLKPTARMIELISSLLVNQANAGEKHRNILLKGMHSLVEDRSAEEQELLKLESNLKQAHGEIRKENGHSYFANGPNTPKVPFAMFAQHRKRFLDELTKNLREMEPHSFYHRGLHGGRASSLRTESASGTSRPRPGEEKYDFIIFEGGSLMHFYDTDMELKFRQEPNFFWLFGVREPNVKAGIDLRTGEAHLFVPRRGENSQVLSGTNATGDDAFKWWKEKYEVEQVSYEVDMERVLIKAIRNGNASTRGVASVLLADQPHDQFANANDAFSPRQLSIRVDPGGIVSKTLRDLRLIKDQWELQIMQYVSDVSAESFVQSMHQSALASQRPGIISMEYTAESTFRWTSAMHGCLEVGYEASCPGGSNTAYFHYGADSWEPNSEIVHPGEMRMLDMAAAYFGYTADVTISYPEDGHFTEKQKRLYNAVREAQVEAEKVVKPGVNFRALQAISEKVLLRHLVDMGILVGDIDELERTRIVEIFMPHGIGHSLGLDCHDDQMSSLAFIEPFKANWVITVEPAMYFNPSKLDELAASKHKQYVNSKVLDEWRDVGGLRLEDDLMVTETGCKVLTRVPRKPEEIEAVMSGDMVWKPWEKPIVVYPEVGSE